MQDLTNIYNKAKKYNNSQLRAVIRSGEYKGQTAGLSKNMLQTNLIILEQKNALDFMIFFREILKPVHLLVYRMSVLLF